MKALPPNAVKKALPPNAVKNFEVFTNPASATRTTLHKTHYGFTVFFSNYGGKSKFQILFKILAFPVHGSNRIQSNMIL